MLTTRSLALLFTLAMTVVGIAQVFAQGYPNRPIRLLVSEPGGGNDFVGRLIAPVISPALGQPVIVENRPGSLIGMEIVSKATPDGYTLLVGSGNVWVLPLVQQTSYDPIKDFSPITLATSAPLVLVVNPSLSVKSVKELIALAKAKPGNLNYGMTTSGSANSLAMELFKAMAGVNMVGIHFKGNGPAVIAVMGGEVHLMFAATNTAMPHIKSGRLTALAATSAQPSVLLPGLPTVAENLPGFESALVVGVLAPAKTPTAIINRLNHEMVRALRQSDVREKALLSGQDVVGNSPAQFAAAIKAEMVRMGKVIKDAGIKAE